MKKLEDWVVFYDPGGKELAAYTVRGTFKGELESTKCILAFDHNLMPDQISTRVVTR